MEVLQWIAKYWVEWLCVIVSGGVVFFAKHYVKMHKEINEEKLKEKESKMCSKIITTLEGEIRKVDEKSNAEDKLIHEDLDQIHLDIDTIEAGVLSIQGKQFKDYCEFLLETGHYITVDEYEEFESDYEVYKNLGGNHRGDALHDRVVDKVKTQMRAENP